PRARRVNPLQPAAVEVGREAARWCAIADALLNGGRLKARTLAPVVGNAGSWPARRTNRNNAWNPRRRWKPTLGELQNEALIEVHTFKNPLCGSEFAAIYLRHINLVTCDC